MKPVEITPPDTATARVMEDLFSQHRNARLEQLAPLADRMRPRTLDASLSARAEFLAQGDCCVAPSCRTGWWI